MNFAFTRGNFIHMQEENERLHKLINELTAQIAIITAEFATINAKNEAIYQEAEAKKRGRPKKVAA